MDTRMNENDINVRIYACPIWIHEYMYASLETEKEKMYLNNFGDNCIYRSKWDTLYIPARTIFYIV